jgi:hypothetical protein
MSTLHPKFGDAWHKYVHPDEDPFFLPETFRMDYWKGIIRYGCNNNLPDEVLRIFYNSPTLNGAIQRLALYTSGIDIKAYYPDGREWPEVNEWMRRRDEGEGLHAAFAKAALDRWLFGGFALKINWWERGTIGEIAYQDWVSCRYGFSQRVEEYDPKFQRAKPGGLSCQVLRFLQWPDAGTSKG